jgi:hypothetical protein
MCRDSEMQNTPTLVGEHKKYMQNLKPDRWHSEEVDGYKAVDVILQESPPLWDGGLRFRSKYMLTLVSPILMPSLSSSP